MATTPGRATARAELRRASKSALDRVAGVRWPLALVVAAVLTGAGLSLNPTTMTDIRLFLRYAGPLLDGRWDLVYAEAGNQAGPLELAWIGVTGRIAAHVGLNAVVVVGVTTAVAVVGAVGLLIPRLAEASSTGPGRRIELLILLTSAVSLAPLAAGWGHPAEVAIPILWMFAADRARRGSWVVAAGTIAGAAGFESWAILGLPLLLAAGLRKAVPAAGIATVGAVVWYLPFALTGSFGMFRQQWAVAPGTLPSLLSMVDVPWGYRLAQAGVVLAVAAGTTLLTRGSECQIWLPVLALVAVRIASDPLPWRYYWCLPLVPLLAAAAGVLASECRGELAGRGRLLVLATCLAAWPHAGPPWGLVQMLASVGLAIAALRARPRYGTIHGT